MNTFNLTLDLNKSRASSPVRLRQGDKSGTTISALILDHGATANLTGMTAQLVMELPDGTQYYRKSASVSGNVVTVVVDESTAASVSGRTANAYFQLLQGTTVKASTGSFVVEILPDALEGHTVPESYDSAIQDAIDALDAAVEQMPSTVEDVLADHPEWTTTVQDGSITKAKLATDLARDRERLLYRLDNLLTAQLPEGETATATDAAQTPVAGLALYGRSTQDGTPTPSAPVPIVSVAPDSQGNISLWARGRNLLDGHAMDTTNKGVTVTGPDADGWYTVSGIVTGTNASVITIFGTQDAQTLIGRAIGILVETEGTVLVSGKVRFQIQGILSTGQSDLVYVDASRTLGYFDGGWISSVRLLLNSTATGTTLSGRFRLTLSYGNSVPSAFSPYTETVTPIPLDGHELRSLPDGTRDELRVDERGHAVLVQRVGHVVLDGSGTEVYSVGSAGTYNRNVIVSRAGFINAGHPDAANAIYIAMCDRLEAKNTAYNTWTTSGISGRTDSSAAFVLGFPKDVAFSDQATFKTWLASNPLTIDYALATPQTIDLGYVAAVPLCGPDLTAQAVPSAPFALTYERDLNTTLARLESAIAELATN